MSQTVKSPAELLQTLEFPGIASCKLKHKITSTEADFVYAGPKIKQEDWHKVLSFFRWTNATAHSEAQARGFINPKTNEILFWVFPQEAGTGMTTKEIAGAEFDKQRSELPDAGELIYFISIHHHCSASAFQSGGDSSNEERPGGGMNETGQDGLHFTVGNMDKDKHDLHFRFYLKGVKLMPKMSEFWDIGSELKSMLPETMHDHVAQHQMTRKVELEFPKQWKDNYIEVKRTPETRTVYHYDGGCGYMGGSGYGVTLKERIEESAYKLIDHIMDNPGYSIEIEGLREILTFLQDSKVIDDILDEVQSSRYDGIDIRNLVKEMEEVLDEYLEDIMTEAANAGKEVDTTAKSRKNKKRRHKIEVKSEPAAQPDRGSIHPNGGKFWSAEQGKWIDMQSD